MAPTCRYSPEIGEGADRAWRSRVSTGFCRAWVASTAPISIGLCRHQAGDNPRRRPAPPFDQEAAVTRGRCADKSQRSNMAALVVVGIVTSLVATEPSKSAPVEATHAPAKPG